MRYRTVITLHCRIEDLCHFGTINATANARRAIAHRGVRYPSALIMRVKELGNTVTNVNRDGNRVVNRHHFQIGHVFEELIRGITTKDRRRCYRRV